MASQRLVLVLACLLLSACAAHDQPRTRPTQSTYWLPLSARDSDRFCVEAPPWDPLPIRCESVGEIRAYLRLMKAD